MDPKIIGKNPIRIPDNLIPFISQVTSGKRYKLIVLGNNYKRTYDSGK